MILFDDLKERRRMRKKKSSEGYFRQITKGGKKGRTGREGVVRSVRIDIVVSVTWCFQSKNQNDVGA